MVGCTGAVASVSALFPVTACARDPESPVSTVFLCFLGGAFQMSLAYLNF